MTVTTSPPGISGIHWKVPSQLWHDGTSDRDIKTRSENHNKDERKSIKAVAVEFKLFFLIPQFQYKKNFLWKAVKTLLEVSISKHKKRADLSLIEVNILPRAELQNTQRVWGFFSHSSFSALSMRPQNIQWFSVTSVSPAAFHVMQINYLFINSWLHPAFSFQTVREEFECPSLKPRG